MERIEVRTHLSAPIEVCFDLARDIGVHVQSTGKTKERAIAGVTEGLIGLGETVTFEAVHFGIRQRLTSKVIEFDPPLRFTDQMTKGAFKSMRHEHKFELQGDGTLMTDIVEFASPFGPIGRIVDRLILRRYLAQFIASRAEALNRLAVEKSGPGRQA